MTQPLLSSQTTHLIQTEKTQHSSNLSELPPSFLLGDRVEKALSSVGITKDVVELWLGQKCNCEERRLKLNQLDLWSRQLLKSGIEKGRLYIKSLLSSE